MLYFLGIIMAQRKTLAPILALVSGLTLNACVQAKPAIKIEKITLGDVGMAPVNAGSWYKGPKEIPFIKMHFEGYYTYNTVRSRSDYDATYQIDCRQLVEDDADDTISAYDPAEVISNTISTYEYSLEPLRDKEGGIDAPSFYTTMVYALRMCTEFMAKAAETPKVEVPKVVAPQISRPVTTLKSSKPSRSSKASKPSRSRRAPRVRAPRPSGRD